MSKRTVFTTITPLPSGITRETVLETLHDHLEMIDLAPTHEERHPCKPPRDATPEEYHCNWYEVTDRVSYLPAGMAKGRVSFKTCFHNLPNGLQTHVYAPMGLDIKEKWTLGGSLPHEPAAPVEIGVGAPLNGLYLREDVEMKCNFLITKLVRKQLKDSLSTLVARLVVKSQLVEAVQANRRLTYDPSQQLSPPLSPPLSPGQLYTPPLSPPPTGALGVKMDYPQQWQDAQNQQQNQAYGNNPARNSYLPYQPQTQQQIQQHIQQQKQNPYQESTTPQQYQQQAYNPQHTFASELDSNQKYMGVSNPAELP